jgi:hypothetical protein
VAGVGSRRRRHVRRGKLSTPSPYFAMFYLSFEFKFSTFTLFVVKLPVVLELDQSITSEITIYMPPIAFVLSVGRRPDRIHPSC